MSNGYPEYVNSLGALLFQFNESNDLIDFGPDYSHGPSNYAFSYGSAQVSPVGAFLLSNCILGNPGLRVDDESTCVYFNGVSSVGTCFSGTSLPTQPAGGYAGPSPPAVTSPRINWLPIDFSMSIIVKLVESGSAANLGALVQYCSDWSWTESKTPPTPNVEHFFKAVDAFAISNLMQPKITVNVSGSLSALDATGESPQTFQTEGVGINAVRGTHLAVTWRASDGRIQVWMNGKLIDSTTGIKTGKVLDPGEGFTNVGAAGSPTGTATGISGFFHGYMQDYASINRLFTDEEIKRQAEIALFGINTRIIAAYIATLDKIVIHFNKAAVGLSTSSNFTFDNGLIVNSVTADTDMRFVELTTSGMVFNTDYTLTIGSGITDCAGNPLEQNLYTLDSSNIQTNLFDESDIFVTKDLDSQPGILFIDREISDISTVQFIMRAWVPAESRFTRWLASGEPDPTALQNTQYTLVELEDIVVEKRYTED